MALFKYDATNNKLVPITSEGSVGIPVGAVMSFAQGTQSPNWLLADGRDTTGTAEELRTHYPALYTYLGNSNVLPAQFDHSKLSEYEVIDFSSEVTMQYDGILVVTAMSANRSINLNGFVVGTAAPTGAIPGSGTIAFKKGDVIILSNRTKGCAKVAYYSQPLYIKATSAGIEVDKDLYATKGYIRDQNILSDYEAVTITTTDTTMDYDGFLYVSVSGGPSPQSYVLLINSDTYSLQNDMIEVRSFANGSYCFPFRKGDKIRAGVSASATYKARFYKLRDYTGR